MDYQKEYFEKNKNWHASDSEEKAFFINLLFQKIKKENIETVLDIACGNGKVFLSFIKDKNFKKLLGLDISKKAIEMAKKNDLEKKVEWRVADIFQENLEKFDLILGMDIIEHIDDKNFLEKIKNNGKYFIFKVPIEDNFLNTFLKKISFGKIDQQKDSLEKYGHINYYTEKKFLKLLAEKDFNVLEKIRAPLPKRTKFFREFLRIIFYPIWFFSEKFYLKFNGGFVIVLLKKG